MFPKLNTGVEDDVLSSNGDTSMKSLVLVKGQVGVLEWYPSSSLLAYSGLGQLDQFHWLEIDLEN